jgi:hypothetical protein
MRTVGPVLLSLAVLSCGSDESPNNPPEELVNTVVVEADGITVYSPEFEVPAGDSFTCIYMDYETESDMAIISGDGVQEEGGHHIIAYYADSPREPGVHLCDDEEMTNLNQIAGSAGDGGQVLELPEGLALNVPAGKQLVLQAHYINTSGGSRKVKDWVKIIAGDPAEVKEFANYFVTNDEGFQLEPNAPLTRTTECEVEEDFQIALALPHMHELGEHFLIEHLDADGNVKETLFDTDWQLSFGSHPPIRTWEMSEPYLLKKGDRLRQRCDWNNSSADTVLFPVEMCLTFFYYWPGKEDLICDMVPVVDAP